MQSALRLTAHTSSSALLHSAVIKQAAQHKLTRCCDAGTIPAGGADVLKPVLGRSNLFVMAARGSPPGEQALYLTGVVASVPEPVRLLIEVCTSCL